VNPAGNSAVSKAGRNALVTWLIVCCVFFACWTPNLILFFGNYVGYPLDFGSWWYHLSVVLVFTNSCVNPFIYAAKYRKFQEGMRRLMSKIRPAGQQPSQSSAVIWHDTVVWSCSTCSGCCDILLYACRHKNQWAKRHRCTFLLPISCHVDVFCYIHCVPKKEATKLWAVTLSNLNRF